MGLVDKGRMPAPLTKLFNMSRSYSLWVYQWGLACCAIEMGAAFASPRYDVMRLGVIPLPASPRQADFVCVSGTVTDKMAPAVQAAVGTDARAEVRDLDGFVRQLRRPVLGQRTRSPRASTRSSRSTSTCPAARPVPRHCSKAIVLLQQRIKNEDMAAKWRGDEYTNSLRTRALLDDGGDTTHGISGEPMPDVAPPVGADRRRWWPH